MLFEVYRDNVRLMHTTYRSCIPDNETIKSLKASGHKVLLDGKPYKSTKLQSNDKQSRVLLCQD